MRMASYDHRVVIVAEGERERDMLQGVMPCEVLTSVHVDVFQLVLSADEHRSNALQEYSQGRWTAQCRRPKNMRRFKMQEATLSEFEGRLRVTLKNPSLPFPTEPSEEQKIARIVNDFHDALSHFENLSIDIVDGRVAVYRLVKTRII